MLLNGARSSFFFVSILLYSTAVFSDDFSQYLPGMSPEVNIELTDKEKERPSAFVPYLSDTLEKDSREVKEKSFVFADESKKYTEPVTEREALVDTGYTLPGTYSNRETIIQTVDSDLYKKVKDQGRSSYSFTYLYDTYDVTGKGGTYTKTYDSGPDSLRAGFVHLTYDELIWGRVGYNAGFGIGFSQGYGVFSGSTRSTTRFKLFMIPIDFGGSLLVFRTNYLSLYAAGGASVMAINQNRDDRDAGDADKNIRQISPGYYASSKLKLSINALYPSLSADMFKTYKITNSYVTLDVRYHNYSSFADNYVISGASFGLGFSFDYY